MEKIQVLPVREQVAAALRRAIFSKELEIGKEITQEQIARMLGVSRMPVREAFQMLERDGLLILKNNRSAVVRGLTREDLRDHYEIRSMLEGEAAARASGNPDSHRELERLNEKVKESLQSRDVTAYIKANEAFHRGIWEASRSVRLNMLLSQLWNGLPPQVAEFLPDQAEKSIPEHQRILDAIRAGDAEAAREAMQAHIRRSMNDFFQQQGTMFVDADD